MILLQKKERIYSLQLMVISLIYAYIMASFEMDLFRDRDNYIVYAIDAIKILGNYLSISIFIAVFNEPFFLLINHVLSFIFTAETILSIFVFITSFTLSYIILKEAKKNIIVLLLLILLLPICSYSFHLQLVTLRQGLATSLFLFSVFKSDKQSVWLATSLACSLIHISFLIISVALILHIVFGERSKSILTTITVQFIFSILMSVGLFIVGQYLGIRQVMEIEENTSSVSGGFFIVWLFVLVYMLYLNKNQPTNKYILLSVIFLTIYLTSYFLNPTAGRLMGTFVPFILIALGKMKPKNSLPLLVILLCLFILTFADTVSGGSLTKQFEITDFISAVSIDV